MEPPLPRRGRGDCVSGWAKNREVDPVKNIKVLGTGCRNCELTASIINQAAKEAGTEIELEKVTDIAEIMAYGIMSTPGIVVDGKVVHSGGLPGPDHHFSADPGELKEWVESIRTAMVMLGSWIVRPTKAEEEMILLARRSVVAVKAIRTGQTLNPDHLGLRRPGNGLAPSMMAWVIGKTATRDIEKGETINLGDFK